MRSLTEYTEQEIDALTEGAATDALVSCFVTGIFKEVLEGDDLTVAVEHEMLLRYSSDISAAFPIGERMKELGVETEYAKELSETTYRDYKHGESSFLRNIFLIAQASPLQRCKAALKAVRAMRPR